MNFIMLLTPEMIHFSVQRKMSDIPVIIKTCCVCMMYGRIHLEFSYHHDHTYLNNS